MRRLPGMVLGGEAVRPGTLFVKVDYILGQ